MKLMRKPVVGETLWVRPTGRASYGESKPIPKRVEMVGRKYFYLEDLASSKFLISTWGEVSEYSAYWVVYEKEQDYWDGIEMEKHRMAIVDFMRVRSNTEKVTLKQYRDVIEILGLTTP